MSEIAKRTTGKAPSMTKGAGALVLPEDRRRFDHRRWYAGASCRISPSRSIGKPELGAVDRAADAQYFREGRARALLPALSDRQRSVGARSDEARGFALRL